MCDILPLRFQDNQNNLTYVRGEFLGEGIFGKCYKIHELNNSNEIYAGKIISKKHLNSLQNKAGNIYVELAIHKSLNHKSLLKFYEHLEDLKFHIIITELCEHGTLENVLFVRKKFTIIEARYFMKQILDGLKYLHDNNIIHGDMKLNNILVNNNMMIKISDFGNATKVKFPDEFVKPKFFNNPYSPPEVVNKQPYTMKADIWPIGCMLYKFLVGQPAFLSGNAHARRQKIVNCKFKIPEYIDRNAMEIIQKTMQYNQNVRPPVSELIGMEFLKGYCPEELPTYCLRRAPRWAKISNSNDYKLVLE